MAKNPDPAIRELVKILEMCEEKGADQEITNKIKDTIELALARDTYCASMSIDPSEAVANIQKQTQAYPFAEAYKEGKTKWNFDPRMMSGSFEGVFLQSIISMTNAKRVLEIGMFTGSAALSCAEALPEDGTVVTCEFDPYLESLARSYFSMSPHGDKIKIRIGPAQDTLYKLKEEKAQFDLVFVDANKDGYLQYFKTVMDEGLLADRGTIILDNALMYGTTYSKDNSNPNGVAIKECNEYLKTRNDIHQVLIPIRDGAMVIRRKSEVYHDSQKQQ